MSSSEEFESGSGIFTATGNGAAQLVDENQALAWRSASDGQENAQATLDTSGSDSIDVSMDYYELDTIDNNEGLYAYVDGTAAFRLLGKAHDSSPPDVLILDSGVVSDVNLVFQETGIFAGSVSYGTYQQGMDMKFTLSFTIQTPNDSTELGFGARLSQGDEGVVIDNFQALGVPPCFAPGTLMLTKRGQLAIEDLRIGDEVITADNGPQRLRWIGKRTKTFVTRDDAQQPIEFKLGSLGPNLPHRKLIVSPLHRMVLSGPHVLSEFGELEVLALAKALTGHPMIRRMKGKKRIDYFALLFDRHEIIFAEGAATESFRPGHVAMANFAPRAREEIYAIYPLLL